MNHHDRVIRSLGVLGVIALTMVCVSTQGQMGPRRIEINFDGTASGGNLTVSTPTGLSACSVSITTTNGETGASVALRFAQVATNENSGCVAEIPAGGIVGSRVTVLNAMGPFMFAGAEQGLGIPEPPRSLTATPYDPFADTVALRWSNPPGGFDSILVIEDAWLLEVLSGDSEQYTDQEVSKTLLVETNDLRYVVVGVKAGKASNGAIINLKGAVQEELTSIPFRAGVMPNWTAWSDVVAQSTVGFTQGTKNGLPTRGSFDTPDRKPFYQVVSGAGTFKAGTWRKFIGLSPGSTYEVSVRVNTLAMDTVASWTYSVHAVHNGTNDVTLSVDQLSGEAALPDGTSGETAGQILKYQAGGPTTKGLWAKRSTSTDGPGKVIGNITLPQGVTSITVWTRHTCSGTTSTGVGLDWIALKKIQ